MLATRLSDLFNFVTDLLRCVLHDQVLQLIRHLNLLVLDAHLVIILVRYLLIGGVNQ